MPQDPLLRHELLFHRETIGAQRKADIERSTLASLYSLAASAVHRNRDPTQTSHIRNILLDPPRRVLSSPSERPAGWLGQDAPSESLSRTYLFGKSLLPRGERQKGSLSQGLPDGSWRVRSEAAAF